MPTNAATPKPRTARKAPAKPRETAAERKLKRDRLAAEQATNAAERTTIAPGVDRVPDAPEISGGALRVSTKDHAPGEREILFYVDDVAYTIPKRFPYGKTLEYATVARKQGMSAAVSWAVEYALGTVGAQVLFDAEQVPDAECERMVTFILGRLEGLPDPK